eukprot:TRINITY_DN94015_c0_g1_i1.p1 TRINITY_DN94015_c0_g1~~TRINITY_DN94015_c0_g1_i1.p1  ORF type:complete len:606 (+),score=104.07 TRINITY_DN94015_c0_g1_i1:154-1971(+)
MDASAGNVVAEGKLGEDVEAVEVSAAVPQEEKIDLEDATALPIPLSLTKLSSGSLPALVQQKNGCETQISIKNADLDYRAENPMISHIRDSLNGLLQQQERCVANILEMMKYMDNMGDHEVASIRPNVETQLKAGNVKSWCSEVCSESRAQSQDSQSEFKPKRIPLGSNGALHSNCDSTVSMRRAERHAKRLASALETARKSIAEQFKRRNRRSGVIHADVKEKVSLRTGCQAIIENPKFDYLIGFIIFVNSVCVGFEAESSLAAEEGGSEWPQEVDAAFVCVYTVELVMRLFVHSWSCFRDPWFLFDFVLVFLGVISNIMLPALIFLQVVPEKPGFLDPILVIRSFRLLRLLRAVRMLKQFQIIWRLVYGLLTSMNAMMSTLILLLLTLYVFACLGIEVITKDSELLSYDDTATVIADHFATLPLTLLTFMQFVSVDSCAAIYAPLIKRKPALMLFFLVLMLVVPIALMNLVTAVLVEGALENSANEKHQLKHETEDELISALPILEQIFNNLDHDGDGLLTEMEVKTVPPDLLPTELFEKGPVRNMEELFFMLDVEGRGWMAKDEFLDGLVSIFVRNVPIETVQILKLLWGITDLVGQDTHDA